MSYRIHMKGYNEPRTLYQTDRLYAWRRGLYFPPTLVELSPLNRCNQKCRYCYSNNKGKQEDRLSDDVLLRCFSDFADAGVNAVLLQGTGEPLLHKGLPKAVENGARRGLSIGLNTNGVPLIPSLQEQMLGNLFYVKFSVLDNDPGRYAHYHGCSEKQWEQLIENIKYAVSLREKNSLQVALWATVYLFRNNFHQAYEMVKFFKDLGLDYVVIQEATFTEDSPTGREAYASTYFSEQEIGLMKEKVLGLCNPDFMVKVTFPFLNDSMNYAGMTKETHKHDFCHGTKFYATISADGEVYPCWRMWGKGKEFSLGNINENTFEEIWRSEKRKQVEEYINSTPPTGAECVVCNHARLNGILNSYKNATTGWKDFII